MSSIEVEEAEVLSQQSVAGVWSILRAKAPRLAALVQPGQSIQIRSGDVSAPVMRAKAHTGVIDLLFREDQATDANAHKAGERLSISGPIGAGFDLSSRKARPLLIAQGLGIAPIIFLAETLREHASQSNPLVFLGTRDSFPFRTRPSTILLPDIPDGVIACMPLLEEWGIASRLASSDDAPGCFDGSASELAAIWLRSLDQTAISGVEVFASGDRDFVFAATELSQQFGIPCQIVQLG